jgi:cytochrome c peroxidase
LSALLIVCGGLPAGAEEFSSRGELVEWLRAQYGKPSEEWPAPVLDPGVPHQELATPGAVPYPEGMEPTPAKRDLGMSLFFDPRLSGSQQISCSRCHDPEKGWSDGRSLATGVFMEMLHRNTPGLHGIAHAKSLFWDGRSPTLEDQARAVILNPKEMAGDPKVIVGRLKAEEEFYPPKFKEAFGDPEITFERVLQALAAFQRGLGVGRSGFDKFMAGDQSALSDSALIGLHLFRTEARCMNCHGGPMFTDDSFHNAGLTYYGRRFEDLGLHAVTGKPGDVGKFRTPSLRNTGRTGPWMHNGLFPSLRGVLNLYNAGMPRPKRRENQMDDPLFPETSPLLKPLGLDATQLDDLEAFLRSLDEPAMRVLTPPFPPLASP